MPVARGALEGTLIGLHHASATTARCASIALGCRSYASYAKSKPKREYMRRIRMAQFRDWYFGDGSLSTTPENVQYLNTHNIAIDNGKAYRLREPRDAYSLLQYHGIIFAYHDSHLVHPFKLDFLNPRGHALADTMRAQLLEQHNTQPLWSIITSLYSSDKAVVRTKAQQRLRASLISALERAGYDKYGKKQGKGQSIYGTAWLTLQSPLKYVNMPPNEEVGNAMVRLLEEEIKSRGRTPTAAPTRAARSWDESLPRDNPQSFRSSSRSKNDWTSRSERPGSRGSRWADEDSSRDQPSSTHRQGTKGRAGNRPRTDSRRKTSPGDGFQDAFTSRR